MINYLKHMAIFARVVEEGSFRAAAKRVGLAPSRISETVSELEQYLGVTLLYRSTRKVSLTSEGSILYARVHEMLRSADAGLDELNALAENLVGTLRISIPAFLATGPISMAIADFATLHPKVNFSVTYTDQRMRLIEDGFDISIRVGWLDDTTLMSRKLAVGQRWLMAGTEYASKHPTPQRPIDLEAWQWIHFNQRPDKADFVSVEGNTEAVIGKAQIWVNSIDAAYFFATKNTGVTILPSHLAKRGVDSGELVRLLPNWELEPLGIYAVWPDNSRRESLTLIFSRFLVDQGLC